MVKCHNCDARGAEFDCNGLKFCDRFCFEEWDREEQTSMDEFAAEYEKKFVHHSGEPGKC